MRLGDVADCLLLDPERSARKMVGHGIPVIRRRQNREQAAVHEAGGDDDREHSDQGLGHGRAEPVERRACGRVRVRAPERHDDDHSKHEGRARQHRPRVNAFYEGEHEYETDYLGEAEEIDR